jgi:hypothetical protein
MSRVKGQSTLQVACSTELALAMSRSRLPSRRPSRAHRPRTSPGARFPAGTFDRIARVPGEDENRTAFVRDAVERELQRREAKQRLAKVKRRLQRR